MQYAPVAVDAVVGGQGGDRAGGSRQEMRVGFAAEAQILVSGKRYMVFPVQLIKNLRKHYRL